MRKLAIILFFNCAVYGIAQQNQIDSTTGKDSAGSPDTSQKHEIIARNLLKERGWIKNRNSALVRGIEGYVKGVYTGAGKIYLLFEIQNRKNISYDIESISFITSPLETGRREIETEEKVYVPIYTNQPQTISKKSSQKIVYVFDKFTIADNKNLLFIMTETDGERTIVLTVTPKQISQAEFVN